MSADDNSTSTENIHATGGTDETPVTTLGNIHATSEPVAAETKAADETAETGTENIHATDEPA
ncbi:hypothetical protein [Streptomyces sp. CRN 30]|uniref:hypothetical protein n=1 Tax=Streptomyces sp. CRN 30 TaxID=3075613 RepID=UPI002A80C63C|nr:hypothetical protein [Streptomyces sp. CRN 30]